MNLIRHKGTAPTAHVWVNLFLLLFLWLDFFRLLELEWRLNAQYHYGYLVPGIAGYLIFLRWEECTSTAQSIPRSGLKEYVITIVCVLLLIPHHIVFEANPDWRLLYWIQGGLLALITGAMISVWGGRKWVWYFAPAFAMLFFAIPWPTVIEQPLVQNLMRMVAAVTVDILNLSGIIAVREGNLISLSNGVKVGIEEACSGVRSLQSSIMASYFLGELLRFFWGWRVALLLIAIPMAVLLNLFRTLFLTLKAYEGGPELMAKWHDTAGNVTTVSGFLLIVLMAMSIKRYAVPPQEKTESVSPGEGRGEICLLKPVAMSVLYLCLLMAPVFTFFWYYFQEPEVEQIFYVDMDWYQLSPNIEFLDIPEETASMLRYSEGFQTVWTGEDNVTWYTFFFIWGKGRISSFAGIHNPEVCLTASGLDLITEDEPLIWKRDGFSMTLRSYEFSKSLPQGKVPYYVFFAVWDNDQNAALPIIESYWERVQFALDGKRIKGRRQLEIIVTGLESLAVAKEKVLEILDRGLTVEEYGKKKEPTDKKLRSS